MKNVKARYFMNSRIGQSLGYMLIKLFGEAQTSCECQFFMKLEKYQFGRRISPEKQIHSYKFQDFMLL